jgi:uncharacterized protein YxeA
MNYENRPNTGALFKREKRSEKAPDYSGPFYGPNGEELEVSAWLKKSKKGETYMSLQVKEKFVPQQRAETKPQPDEFDEDLPF